MYQMLGHLEIGHIKRTGYLSWIKDRDLDVDAERGIRPRFID